MIPICSICNKEMEVHPIAVEWTCFIHGNPNGSELERKIFEKYQAAGIQGVWS